MFLLNHNHLFVIKTYRLIWTKTNPISKEASRTMSIFFFTQIVCTVRNDFQQGAFKVPWQWLLSQEMHVYLETDSFIHSFTQK